MLPHLCSNMLRVSLLNLRYRYLEIGIFEPCKYKPYVVFETLICNMHATACRQLCSACVCFETVAAHLMFDLLDLGQECSAWCSKDTVQVTPIMHGVSYLLPHMPTELCRQFACLILPFWLSHITWVFFCTVSDVNSVLFSFYTFLIHAAILRNTVIVRNESHLYIHGISLCDNWGHSSDCEHYCPLRCDAL
jgi:hypothetical protein